MLNEAGSTAVPAPVLRVSLMRDSLIYKVEILPDIVTRMVAADGQNSADIELLIIQME